MCVQFSAVRARGLTILLLVLALAAAGCSGDAEVDPGTQPTTEAAPTTGGTETDTGATETTPPEPEPFPEVTPGPILQRFVRAAAANDSDAMWRLLSIPSQRRLGPTPAQFRNGAGARLARQVGVFIPGRSRVFLEEPITALFAVAAYGGRTSVGEGQPFGTYAAAMRREEDGWRIELGGPVQLDPLGPDPGEVASGAFQVAAGIEANAGIIEAGVWLDGQAVPGRASGAGDARRLTIFGESTDRIPRGPHAVVAFASTFAEASALAWMFTYRAKPARR